MKRPTSINTKVHEDIFDSLSSAPTSSNTYPDDVSSLSITRNSSLLSDSDSLSDSSKKIRKKRNTYQKIPDDIRVNLLEAVQNGETLKAAAKRHKINYSSAKSILHTYRKEGRILKKSAQERGSKKRDDDSADEEEEPSKPVKSSKKENVQPKQSDSKAAPSFTPSLDRTKSEPVTTTNFNEKNNQVSPRHALADNSLPMMKAKSYEPNYEAHFENKTSIDTSMPHHNYQGLQKNEDPFVTMFSAPENHGAYEPHHIDSMDNLDGNRHFTYKPKLFANFFTGHFDAPLGDMGSDHLFRGSHDYGHYSYPREFDSFNDMMTSFQFAPSHQEEYFPDPNNFLHQRGPSMANPLEDKTNKVSNGMDYEDFGESSLHSPLKNFLDTQKLLQQVIGKTSTLDYSNNAAAFRRGSMDFY